MAAEQDEKGLIDGIAVSEPMLTPVYSSSFGIQQGCQQPFYEHSRSVYEYTAMLNVYQGSAIYDSSLEGDATNERAETICTLLHAKRLLRTRTTCEQAAEARKIINDFGILTEQNSLMRSHWNYQIPQAVTLTFANSHSRSGVEENVGGYSFGATRGDGKSEALACGEEALLFGTSTGIPPTGGIRLINNRRNLEYSASTPEENLDGALELYALALGRDPVTGARLIRERRELSEKLAQGIAEIRVNGDLDGKPTIFVTGRADAIVAPNHASRAYVGLNQLVEGDESNMRYYEVTNAHHLDSFNGYPGFNSKFIPLHHYFMKAMDLMYDHLRNGTPLPASQVVCTKPRGLNDDGTVPAITPESIPPIAMQPAADIKITFEDNILRIPDPPDSECEKEAS